LHETDEDVRWLQDLLDRSYQAAGSHLREIHSDAARVTAGAVVARLQGMKVLVVATVSADGRPLTGPVDGFFHRGRWHFGTSPDAFRARHLARSPAVSATYVHGEELVVTVHGRARRLDLAGDDAGFVQVLRDKYGDDWDDWAGAAPHFAIEPDRMYAADMSVYSSGDASL
jgi:hypothetical protein